MELCRDCQAAVEYYARNATALSDVSVDISSTKVKCVLPEWQRCSGTVKGLGGLLVATGVSLLLVATLTSVAFDWRLLPFVVALRRRQLLVEDAAALAAPPCGGTASHAVPPPPAVPAAPPTPAARPPETLRGTGLCSPRAEALGALGAQGAPQREAREGRQELRPRNYASAYALHFAFLIIACLAVILRVSYVVARALLLVGWHLAYQCLPELLLCILPLAWVACTSRRPSSSTAAVPMSVAYWGPWQTIPRFTTYAVCTILSEIYSTLVAALAVARLPCDASPVAGVFLYCIGLLVAVGRAYCAVLALRLQDELASVCRRGRLAAWDGARAAPKEKAKKSKFLQGLTWTNHVIEDTVRDFNDPDPASAELCCPTLPEYLCPVLRRRLVGRRILAGGIILALLSAVASAFIVKAVMGEQQVPEENLSSCAAAQNGTTTCAAFHPAGINITNAEGERKMDMARSLSDCCRGCDEVTGCQGWIFEHLDKRCRWVHFVDEVCNANPGDMSCRCFTSRGIAFGFKPPKKTQLIWVDYNWD